MSGDVKSCFDCGDETRNEHGRCRDCDIRHSLDIMQCSVCERMRYRTETAVFKGVGAYLWGDPCTCDPKPPSVYEARK